MKTVKLLINNQLVFDKITIATNFFEKFMGLMFKKSINNNEGIYFINTSQIHTSFMQFSIDVVYLNKDNEVLFIETVRPWKIGSRVKNAKHVLELNEGIGNKLSIGDKINIVK